MEKVKDGVREKYRGGGEKGWRRQRGRGIVEGEGGEGCISCELKQNGNESCNSCASLAGLVLCFITCFILLVITPLHNLY